MKGHVTTREGTIGLTKVAVLLYVLYCYQDNRHHYHVIVSVTSDVDKHAPPKRFTLCTQAELL